MLFVAACAEAPTKVFSSEDADALFLEKSLGQPITIDEKTVVIDARPPFDFAVIHYPTAVNMQWSDFADTTEGAPPGRLTPDLTDAARRLALAGIDLNSQVVVVGKGLEGAGAEGRIAWTLLYMGFKNVQTADVDKLGLRYSNLSSPPRENRPFWKPVLHPGLLADKDDLLAARGHRDISVIDVRSTAEFLNPATSLKKKYSDMKVFNIPWSRFFTPKGRPNPAVRGLLEDAKIHLSDRIIVISNEGVLSGAVTYALLSLGYTRPANYAGGFIELFDLKP